MGFRVELSDRAQTDIAAIYDWLHAQVGQNRIESGRRVWVILDDENATRY
jgi:plasmid stabilization system protein ParE